jgi:hypothetical protein
MKKLIFILAAIASISSALVASAQDTLVTYKGRLVTKTDKLPLTGASIKIKSAPATAAITDVNGNFIIKGKKNDTLTVSCPGYSVRRFAVSADNTSPEIALEETAEALAAAPPGGGGSVSEQSYWVGASIGYNVNKSGGSANNIIGAAAVTINPVTKKIFNADLAIVGNIGNFVSTQTKDDIASNISKLSQANNGLNIGLSATWKLNDPKDTVNALRFFALSGYQLNAFQKVGPDTTSVSLSQWRNTAGFEFEGLPFKNGGVMHFGVAATLGIFDQTAYQQIFMNKKSNILSLDASIILPLSKQFGFVFEGTYSQYTTPVYLIGVVIKNLTK